MASPFPNLTNNLSVHANNSDSFRNGITTDAPELTVKDVPVENFRKMRVVVIGAGFSGIYLGVRIPQRLRNVELAIYEKNDDVGGTWYENRYPGCACDIPCKLFSSVSERRKGRLIVISAFVSIYIRTKSGME